MRKSLQRSREVTAAAKAIAALGCPALLSPRTEIRWRGDIVKAGIPATIEAVDYVLDMHRRMLAVGHSFARFMTAYPNAPVLLPQNFPAGSLEHKVLTHVRDVVVGDCDDNPSDPDDGGPGIFLYEIERALRIDDEGRDAHLTRSDAWTLLAYAEREIAALIRIRRQLEPLVEETAQQ